MDLITEKWLPVVLENGERARISLSELLDNRILDVAYPRADFQGAAWQMLVGLLQCTVAPEDEGAWEETWFDGIDPEKWQQALAVIAPALQFGPEKPAFLQSFDPLDSEPGTIAGLLIDAPGGNTLKLNKDHFVKRDSTTQICPHCAVMALFSVQTNSPAGGAGYRVGMRGGGPLTTLAVPDDENTFPLWKKLWLNVLEQETPPDPAQFPLIFPWLAPTRISDKAGNMVTPENAHPLQAYWGMPRRIELDFATTRPGCCDLCGEEHPALLLQMRTKNYGVQYESWLHPFSPYRQALKDPSAPWLALKGQPGGLSYKDWLGLLLKGEDKFNRIQPARAVRAAQQKGAVSLSLWCFAFDMDNAKVRCWYQHRLPVLNIADAGSFRTEIQLIVALASGSLSILKSALKNAKFENPKEAKFDTSMVDTAFWQETEPAFRQLAAALAENPRPHNAQTCQALKAWERALHHYLLQFFDNDVLTDPDSPDDILLRQLAARRGLELEYCKQKVRKEVSILWEEQKEKQHAEQ